MNIPNYEIQKRIFGYATDEIPPTGSLKAKVYELIEQGLDETQIEKLSLTWKRKQNFTQKYLINPIIEKSSAQN